MKKKVMKAVTGTGNEKELTSGVKNLFLLLELTADKKNFNKFKKNRKVKYSKLKTELADAIIDFLKPIQKRKKELLKNKNKVQKILNDGAKKAQKVAQKNILEIKKRMGLV